VVALPPHRLFAASSVNAVPAQSKPTTTAQRASGMPTG